MATPTTLTTFGEPDQKGSAWRARLGRHGADTVTHDQAQPKSEPKTQFRRLVAEMPQSIPYV
jgi:hypothetical protein